MSQLLDPCPNCGRAMVDWRGYASSATTYCWYCEDRAAGNLPLAVLTAPSEQEAL